MLLTRDADATDAGRDYNRSMVTTITQVVTVEAGGRVAIESPELLEGESAEVVVTVRRTVASPVERLNALKELRESLRLTPASASQWENDIQAERAADRSPSLP